MKISVLAVLIAVFSPTLLGGCSQTSGSANSVADSASPSSGNSKLTGRRSLNCELKNGPTGCTDDQAQAAAAIRTRAASAELPPKQLPTNTEVANRSSDATNFSPWMCKRGGGGFIGFWGGIATGQFNSFMEYCRKVQDQENSAPEVASSASDVDKSGTWLCELANGVGPIYGVYQMVNNPRVIRSTCRRVGN